ncbi:lycopene cyclase family protein [Ornithinimicrobium tianjinense]|uniref:Lycopene cyclase n=1 Tax=Ornithinimicrobium tianjinense TaxID=1195761 RepID=A0A917BFB6_9MICO|nr:lycopene cyclase family protein [Ornithinimicrobium tianjinense]GGF37325.1 lycopene cyclase [Ornithinimicrobium tianjinense]
MADVAVVGLGPAGRSLAARCAARGLSVIAVDPRPGAVWTPTYGIWGDELGDLPASVVRGRAENPELRATGVHPLRRPYLVLDNAALQAALPLNGVDVRTGRLDDRAVSALRAEARVVVDARGARPEGLRPDDPAPMQTAYGVVVALEVARPALQGAEALLMDWRTDWSEQERPTSTPTFLYAIPVGDGQVLLEETCLAAAPSVPIEELKTRLRRRLAARGADPGAVDDPVEREIVRIPMRGRDRPAPPGVLALGTAGRGGHRVTGYSVAHALRVGDRLAATLARGDAPTVVDQLDVAERVREVGLRALLGLSTRGTLELFEAFGRLPVARQRAFLSRDAGAAELLGAMWGMFAQLPARSKAELIRVSALGVLPKG